MHALIIFLCDWIKIGAKRLEKKWIAEMLLAVGFTVNLRMLLFFLLAFYSNLSCNPKRSQFKKEHKNK